MLKLFTWNFCCDVFIDRMLKLSSWNLHFLSIKPRLFDLFCGHIPSLDGLDRLLYLLFRLLLRNGWSFGCNRVMCDREVFIFLGDLMYKLWSGVLSSLDWFFSVLFLCCRFILRHYRIISHDRSVCGRILLCSLGICVLKLSSWNLCCGVFNFKLLKLSGGNLPSINWFNSMLCMYCWFVLCHHGIICRHRRLCCGILFCFVSDCVLELSRWDLFCFAGNDKLFKLSRGDIPSIDWLNRMPFMYCRFILCHHGIICRHRRLCSGILFCFVSDCMLELSRWDLY